MRNRAVGFILLFFGSVSLYRISHTPRLDALHGSDIVQLLGSGACLGVAMVALLGRLKLRSE